MNKTITIDGEEDVIELVEKAIEKGEKIHNEIKEIDKNFL